MQSSAKLSKSASGLTCIRFNMVSSQPAVTREVPLMIWVQDMSAFPFQSRETFCTSSAIRPTAWRSPELPGTAQRVTGRLPQLRFVRDAQK
jgi:hypothetical protein